jgi:thiamine-phosphate pyrophosphorylase
MQASRVGMEYLGMIFSRLYAIVDAEVLVTRGVGLREFAEGLRAAGVGLVQWRDKVGSPQEVLAGAAVLREIFEGDTPHDSDGGAVAIMGHPRSLLIMNDRADLAVLAGFGGVHVGQGDLLPEDAKAVVLRTIPHPSQGREGWGTRIVPKDKFWVGVSTHTEEQVRVAEASCADYVAIGPVFATGTKADAEAVVGLEGVRRARALTGKPIVAIGGITRENARSVIEAGADSVAVISGLFGVGETVEKVAGDFLRILG